MILRLQGEGFSLNYGSMVALHSIDLVTVLNLNCVVSVLDVAERRWTACRAVKQPSSFNFGFKCFFSCLIYICTRTSFTCWLDFVWGVRVLLMQKKFICSGHSGTYKAICRISQYGMEKDCRLRNAPWDTLYTIYSPNKKLFSIHVLLNVRYHDIFPCHVSSMVKWVTYHRRDIG